MVTIIKGAVIIILYTAVMSFLIFCVMTAEYDEDNVQTEDDFFTIDDFDTFDVIEDDADGY